MLIIDFFPRIWMTHSFSWGGAAKEGGGLNKEGKGLIEEVNSSAFQTTHKSLEWNLWKSASTSLDTSRRTEELWMVRVAQELHSS